MIASLLMSMASGCAATVADGGSREDPVNQSDRIHKQVVHQQDDRDVVSSFRLKSRGNPHIQTLIYSWISIPAIDPRIGHIYSKKLVITPNRMFRRAHVVEDAFNQQIEFIPYDQTLDDWTDMITIQGMKGIGKAPGMTLEKYVSLVMLMTARNCRSVDDHVWSDLGPYRLLGKGWLYDARVFMSGCRSTSADAQPVAPGGISEAALYIVVDGGDDYYQVFYSRRDRQGAVPIQSYDFAGYLRSIVPVRLCESTVSDEQCLGLHIESRSEAAGK